MEADPHILSPVQNSIEKSNSFNSSNLKQSVSFVSFVAQQPYQREEENDDEISYPQHENWAIVKLEDGSTSPGLSSIANTNLYGSVSRSSRTFHGKALSREREARRLAQVLNLTERGKLSKNFTPWLFQTQAIAAKHSYESILRHPERRSRIIKRYKLMCSEEHTAPIGTEGGKETCKSKSCKLLVSSRHKFWYLLLSEMLSALCAEKKSFQQILEGCSRAQRSALDASSSTMYDYYDGTLFQRKFGKLMKEWNEERELFVFLTMSSDEFEIFK